MILPFLSEWLKEKDEEAVSEAQCLNARCLELPHSCSSGDWSPKAASDPSLETLKCSAGHCAQACHLRRIYKKPSKWFDVSAFLLIQIINEKIDFLDQIPSSLMETDDLTKGILPFI